MFTVRSRNKEWLSRPSIFTRVIKTLPKPVTEQGLDHEGSVLTLQDVRSLLSTKSVDLVSVEPISGNSLKVVWETLASNTFIEGVHIRFLPLVNTEKNSASIRLGTKTIRFAQENREESLKSDAVNLFVRSDHNRMTKSSYTLGNLRPETKYQVFVVPFYGIVEGLPSSSLEETTLQAPPIPIPTGVHYNIVNASTVKVVWDEIPVDESYGNAPHEYYYQVSKS